MTAKHAGAAARAIALAAGAACLVTAASAAEFRSVSAPAAVMYDGPSQASRKLFVAPRGMPVEVVSQSAAWVRVRDLEGSLVWVERADLGTQRTVVARAPFAAVRDAPQESAALLFRADRGVWLELLEPAPVTGWARVRHRDGTDGYVRATEVWGL